MVRKLTEDHLFGFGAIMNSGDMYGKNSFFRWNNEGRSLEATSLVARMTEVSYIDASSHIVQSQVLTRVSN